MGILIDTSALIAVERSQEAPAALFASVGDQPAYLASISAAELLHGVHRAESALRRERRGRFVEAVFSLLPVLPFDLEVARTHARLWADLSRQGQQIGAHDLLIAATALFHGLDLLAGNAREFERVDGLGLVLWR